MPQHTEPRQQASTTGGLDVSTPEVAVIEALHLVPDPFLGPSLLQHSDVGKQQLRRARPKPGAAFSPSKVSSISN